MTQRIEKDGSRDSVALQQLCALVTEAGKDHGAEVTASTGAYYS